MLRFVARRTLFENRHKMTACRRYANVFASYDFLCLDGVSIDLFTRLIVRTKGGAGDGYSSEETA